MMPMRPLIALVLLVAIRPLPAQDLPRSLPADVLGYLRVEQPGKMMRQAFETGIGTIRAAGAEVESPDEVLAKGMEEADAGLGLEPGTMMTWITSVASMEFAVHHVEITGFIPEVEFAMVLHTPQAKGIYETATRLLQKHQFGSPNDDGTTQVDAMGFWQGILAHRDDRLVLASDPTRLRETMDTLSDVKAGSLAQSTHWKAMFGGERPAETIFYANLSRILTMIRDEMPRADLRQFELVAGPLGLWDLEALGYRQAGGQSWTQIRGSKTIPAFDYLSGTRGTADVLRRLPGTTAFSLTWPGELMPVWRKATGYFLDSTRFPGAARLTERLAGLQRTIGAEIPEVLAAAGGGVTMGWLPQREGREEDWSYGVIGLADPDKGGELLARVLGNLAERRSRRVETTQEGGATWFRMMREDHADDITFVLTEGRVLIGTAPVLEEVLAGMRTSTGKQSASIAATPALKGLAPQASAVFTLNLASAFMRHVPEDQQGAMSALFAKLTPIGATIDFTPKTLEIHANTSIPTLLTTASMGLFTARAGEAVEAMPVDESEAPRPVTTPADPAKPTEPDSRPASGGGDRDR